MSNKPNTLRTYGVVMSRDTFADSPAIMFTLMAKTPNEEHPINPRHEGEHVIWDAPKSVSGLILADLQFLIWQGDTYVTEPHIEYRGRYSADVGEVRKMLKTLERVEREIGKAQSREPGDIFMAMARALNLTFLAISGPVVRRDGFASYRNHDWTYEPITKARDELRRVVAEFEAVAAQARKAREAAE